MTRSRNDQSIRSVVGLDRARGMTVDRFGARPVCSLVMRSWSRGLWILVLLVAVAACGGKKKDAKTAASSGKNPMTAGPGVDPAYSDPDNGYGAAPLVDGGGDDGSPEAGEEAGDPALRPPGLDLTPAQQQTAVNKHLGAAWKAVNSDPDTAIAEAKAALAADETSVNAMVALGHANFVKGYFDLAEDVLTKAIERGGAGNKQAHFLLGLVYEKTDRKDQAPAAYARALNIDPNYRSALMNVGVHHLANARYQDAISVFERLTTSLGVTTAAAYNNLASAYRGQSATFTLSDPPQRNKLILEAERMYRQALNQEKNYVHAYYNLGILYLDADPFPAPSGELDRLVRLKKAKSYFDEYRRLPGADVKRADDMGAVAQKLIDREELIRKKAAEREAKAAARKAREAEPAAGGGDDDGFE